MKRFISILFILTILFLFFFFLLLNTKETPTTKEIIWAKNAQGIKNAQTLAYKSNPDFIDIDFNSVKQLSYDDFSKRRKEQRFIPLRSTEAIGEVSQLYISENRIIVLDNYKSNKIFLFDWEGNFIAFAGSQGRGPGEYISPIAITIQDTDSPYVVVHEGFSPYKHYYDLENGNFIKTESAVSGKAFAALDSFTVQVQSYGAYSKGAESNSNLIITKKDSVLFKAFPFKELQKHATHFIGSIYSSKEEVIYNPTYSDTVYSINKDLSYSPLFSVQFENSASKYLDSYQDFGQDTRFLRSKKASFLFPTFIIDKQYIFFKVSHQNLGTGSFVYDKTQKNLFQLFRENKETMDFSRSFQFQKKLLYKDYLVSYINSDNIYFYKELKNKGVLTNIDKEINQVLNEDDKTSNVDVIIVLEKY